MPAGDGIARRQGTLAEWDDDRGFGFISPEAGGPRVFVHVSAFPRDRRPATGCRVTYADQRDQRGRPRASAVCYLDGGPSRRTSGSGALVALAAATLFFALLTGLVAMDELPLLLVAAYGVLSALAFAMYGADKSAARQGTWRTPESTLHTIDLAGGWPGALVARRVFRHKTTKQPFRTVFWLTVALNCAALAWVVSGGPTALF